MHSTLVKKLPFYYGWVIATVCGVSGAFISGTTSWGLGIFVTPMQEEFGWNRTLFYLPLAVGAVVSAIGGPIFGPAFDRRYGARIAFGIGVVLFAGSLLAMRNVTGFSYYLVVYGIIGGMGHFGLMAARAILPKWFIRKRGRAFAVAGGLTSLGPLLFPPILQLLVNGVGWREAWMFTGIAFVVLMAPAVMLLVRSPEDLGIQPDGNRANEIPDIDGADHLVATETNYTREEAIRTLRFWLLVVAVVAGTISIRGMIPNIQPFLVHQGLDPTTAALSFSVYAITTILAAFVWGNLADQHGARAPFLALTIVMGTAMGFLWIVDVPSIMFLAMTYLGIGVNSFFIMGGLFVANSFGRAHYGGVSGLFQPFNNAATYGGPLIFGVLYDLSGNSYGTLFSFATSLWVVSFVTAYLVDPQRK